MTRPPSSAADAPQSRVLAFNHVASTNATALKLASEGDTGGLWVLAESQTAGRGRSGRTWTSEPGNLYASYLSVAVIEPILVPQISLVAGLAAAEAIDALAARDQQKASVAELRLKWPNDLLVGAAKLGGVLVETAALPGSARPRAMAIVIGFGINVGNAPALADRLTVSLAELGLDVKPPTVLRALDSHLRKNLAVWNDGSDFAAIRSAWMAAAGPVDEPISQTIKGRTTTGVYKGLDCNGALLMADETGSVQKITVGDVDLQR